MFSYRYDTIVTVSFTSGEQSPTTSEFLMSNNKVILSLANSILEQNRVLLEIIQGLQEPSEKATTTKTSSKRKGTPPKEETKSSPKGKRKAKKSSSEKTSDKLGDYMSNKLDIGRKSNKPLQVKAFWLRFFQAKIENLGVMQARLAASCLVDTKQV